MRKELAFNAPPGWKPGAGVERKETVTREIKCRRLLGSEVLSRQKQMAGRVPVTNEQIEMIVISLAQRGLLDNTLIVWTNELGKGNNHTRDNIPFVMVGGGLGYKMGRAMKFEMVPHNRLLMSLCEAMGYPQESFGNPNFCGDGVLTGLS